MFKKRAHWNKEKQNFISSFTDSENYKIGEIDENYFEMCLTFKLSV